MARQTFKTVDEAVEYLFCEEIEADIIAVPPEVDELTDEENVEDEMVGNTRVNDIAGTAEIFHEEDNEEICKISAKRVRKEDVKWFPNLGQKAYHLCEEMKQKLSGLSPMQVFEELFSDDVINVIVEETDKYAKEYKNKINFSVHRDDVRVLIGFLIFTGYHKLSSERNDWSEDDDLVIQIVKDAISRNKYPELKSVLHFNDNKKANENKGDKSFKLKPLIWVLVRKALNIYFG
jgi:hypothetical protein